MIYSILVVSLTLTFSQSLPDFRVKLFFASLQKDSHLKPQEGEYLKDSFRVETLAPFAQSVVNSLSTLDKRATASEHGNLCYRVAFSCGLILNALAVAIIAMSNQKRRKVKANASSFVQL